MRGVAAIEAERGRELAHYVIDGVRVHRPAFVLALAVRAHRPEQGAVHVIAVAGELKIRAYGGDLVAQHVLVLLVERDALADDRLVVAVKRDAARFVDAWALEVAGLDFERIEAAVVVGIEPFADRKAGPSGLLVLGEAAAVGV